ncbi:MAG: EamA family transporter [Deltaproteobacteria bacterium]|nr:EamA family transporter [Deltaproteobacteria bacterium]
MQDRSFLGYLAVVGAALMWASSGTLSKALFVSGTGPLELVQVRVTFASMGLGIVLLLADRELLRIRARDLMLMALLGGVGMALVQSTYYYSISKINVMAAILIQYLGPVIVGLYSIAFWGERLTAPKSISLLLAVGGCYLVAGGYNLALLELNRIGVLVALAAAFCFAAYSLLGERAMHRYSPWTVTFYSFLFAAVTWHLLIPPFHYLQGSYGLREWLCIAYIVVVGTIAPFGLYFVGVNYVRATRASITATLEPIAAGLMAFGFLGETMEPLQLLGAGFTISAIVLLQLNKEQDMMTPELVRSRSEQDGGYPS